MASIFSTQNLQTFLRRKYLRPPSRPPGPPGPPARGGRRSPRSPLWVRSPPPSAPDDVGLVSSAMMLLKLRFRSYGRPRPSTWQARQDARLSIDCFTPSLPRVRLRLRRADELPC